MNCTLTKVKRRGMMFVLSSPSGAGKTTISRKLIDLEPDLTISISLTTRKRRPGEVSGRDYFFVDEEQFSQAITDNNMLEYAKVFGNYYGTPKKPVEEALTNGFDVLFDIDWQGTQQLGSVARGDLVTVFLLPPDWGELERRLIARAQDHKDVVDHRMSRAEEEMSHWAEYDYVVVNDDLDHAIAEIRAILKAERLKRTRQVGLGDFVKKVIQRQ